MPGTSAESVAGSAYTDATGMTSRSTLLSVIKGVGALDCEADLEAKERAASAKKRPKLVEPYDAHCVSAPSIPVLQE